jgi:hypothetical protein
MRISDFLVSLRRGGRHVLAKEGVAATGRFGIFRNLPSI